MARRRRKQRRWLGTLFWGALFLIFAFLAESRRRLTASVPERASPPGFDSQGPFSRSIHVALGIPTDADSSDDYLLDQRVYVASYNPAKRVPNWVSWNLNQSWLGRLPRTDSFRSDPLLPSTYYHVTAADYRHSGYDRGHLCPAADRQASREDNAATFLMTNIHPQVHELNAGPWEELEQHTRELARRPGAELFVVAGGVFSGPVRTIGHGVTVPSAAYKIVVVLERGQAAANVAKDTPVIAVILPNQRGVGAHRWNEFLTTIDDVERQTGYDFLSRVPASVQQVLEAQPRALVR